MIELMKWWERQASLIPLSWLGYLVLSGWLWRLEERTPETLRALKYLPLRGSVMLLLLATVVHLMLYRWRSSDDGWLWAAWCSLLYAAIIISIVLWRISMTAYV